jgi:BspA type Leucine rich repeat region (6 copies)
LILIAGRRGSGYTNAAIKIMPSFVYCGQTLAVLPWGTTCIVIPPFVTELDRPLSKTFLNPDGLDAVTSVRVHCLIDYLPAGAFMNLHNLTKIKNLSSLMQIDTIRKGTFHNCRSLKSIDLSRCAMLSCVEELAFAECQALKRVRLPDRVKQIGKGAFRECRSLEDITIPSRVTEIAEATFFCCTSLQHIHIPAKVTKIQDGAFFGCNALGRLTFAPEGDCALEYLGCIFLGVAVEFLGGAEVGGSMENFSLPPSVTDMSLDAFSFFPGRIKLPWGQFEEMRCAGVDKWAELTMAFVLLQRAGKSCGLPIHRMHNCNDPYSPTAADLVNLLTALLASPEFTLPADADPPEEHVDHDEETDHEDFEPRSPDDYYDRNIEAAYYERTEEAILTQAILLVVKTFPEVLFGNPGDPGTEKKSINQPEKSSQEIASTSTISPQHTVPPPPMCSKKRKSCS